MSVGCRFCGVLDTERKHPHCCFITNVFRAAHQFIGTLESENRDGFARAEKMCPSLLDDARHHLGYVGWHCLNVACRLVGQMIYAVFDCPTVVFCSRLQDWKDTDSQVRGAAVEWLCR